MEQDSRIPLYPIGIVAELIGTHPRTLRTYERQGLLRPSRRGGKRFYSNNELRWLKCLRKLLTRDGLDISGVKKLLSVAPCWSIRSCSEQTRRNCPAVLDIPLPCWELNHRSCCTGESCFQCEVYARKMDQAMEMSCLRDAVKP